MDPVEVREERMTTGTTAAPVTAAPATAAPVAGAPATGGTTVYSSRTGVYPIGYRGIQIVWLVAGVVNIVLAMDFIFRAASANDTGFAKLIYGLGRRLAAPFDGIFNTTAVANGTSVLRWSDLLAVAVYSILAWIVTKVIRISAAPRSGANTI